ncbi:MAG: triphosphoribosyl-dephospho-CoA synthase MdcB [Rubrivivax sp.]
MNPQRLALRTSAERPSANRPNGLSGVITDRLQHAGRAAVAALYDELALETKPGLVSPVDNGSHRDMTAQTFMRSLFALRHSFPRLVRLGAEHADFSALERVGVAAEARMLDATGGINTHRGAIFCLGLLCASAGALLADGEPVGAGALRRKLMINWGETLARRVFASGLSNGASAVRRFGLRSAGGEAAAGFPTLFETTWPALRAATEHGLSPREARLQALFETIAVLDDTNLAHRGGLAGLRHAQHAARDYLLAGGVCRADGMAQAQRVHRDFVERNLSPGGAADTLAAACWIQRVTDGPP